MKNYYEILEVNKKASKEVIEKAYKVLVKKYHPDGKFYDKKIQYEEKIKEINEAYEVLSDPFLREQYDLELEKEEKRKYEMNHHTEVNNNRVIQEQNNSEKAKTKKVKENEFISFIELLKEVFNNKTKREEIRDVTRRDILAIILTIGVIITLGIILWCIPFRVMYQ